MFSILHPALFSAGVACVAIPIIIHLLRRKRKPVTWGAMRFLEQAYRKRKRILTIEQLILLALRCILILLLGAGVGGLMLGSASTSSQPIALTILLDNSISSALRSSDSTTSLDQSKAAAYAALDMLDPARGDRAALLTLAAPAAAHVLHPSTDLDSIRSLIESTTASDSAADIAGALDLINAQDTPEQATIESLLIASSFRSIDARSLPSEARSARFARVLARAPESAPHDNVGIAELAPSRSLRLNDTATTLPISVRVSLIRSGSLDQSRSSITLTNAENNEPIGSATHQWDQGESEASLIIAVRPDALTSLRAGSAAIRAEIDDDANPRDNSARTIISLRQTLRVGVIESLDSSQDQAVGSIRASRALRAALSPSPSSPIDLVVLDHARLSAQRLSSLDTLFVLTPGALDDQAWGLLANANRSGLVLIITPDVSAPTTPWISELDALGILAPPAPLVAAAHGSPRLLSEQLPEDSALDTLSSEYPALSRSVRIDRSIDLSSFTNSTPIALFEDGSSFAARVHSEQSDRAPIILLASALEFSWSDLPARPLFVPMMQELIRQSVGSSRVRPPLIAGQRSIDPASLIALSDSPDPSPRRAGLYASLDQDGAARSIIAINPDAQGARTTLADESTLSGQLTQLFQTDSIQWIDSDPASETPLRQANAASVPSFGFPGFLFLLASIVGVLELVLARVFSFREQSIQSGSNA